MYRNVEVDPNINANLFFWHFENKHIADKARTVIWLNGGPGCSSLDGALMEIGPLRVLDNRLLIFKDGAWNEYANLLFIDQPAGTGFSYVNTDSYDHEIDVSSNHLIRFMEKWFALFPQYETDEVWGLFCFSSSPNVDVLLILCLCSYTLQGSPLLANSSRTSQTPSNIETKI